MADSGFSCDCGAVRGTLRDIGPGWAQGTHAQCYCPDCRGAQLYLGRTQPEGVPVDLYQTTPDRVTIEQGLDRIGVFAWRRPGMLRWHATCCDTPLFNTPGAPGIAFTTVMVNRLDDPRVIGPVVARAFIPKPNGKRRHEGLARLVLGMLRRSIPARVSGRWQQTPFFDLPEGRPVRRVTRLTAEERDAVYARDAAAPTPAR